MRATPLTILLVLAGCGTSQTPDAANSNMPARSWKYYADHPAEIASMQKICRQWTGSNTPANEQPAVVATNCRAAAFAKSQLRLTE